MPPTTKLNLLTTALCCAGLMPSVRAQSPESVSPLTGEQSLSLVYVHDWEPAANGRRLVKMAQTDTTLNDAGQLVAFDDGGPNLWQGQVFDSGNDGILAWGRWTRDTIGGSGTLAGHSITGAEGVRNSFRYITGVPAPRDAVAALRASGGPATFSLLGGGTGPTAGEGGGVSITLLTQGTVTVQPGGKTIAMELSFRVASGIYTLTATDIPLEGAEFASQEPIPTHGVLCITGCSTQLSGFLAGEQAQRAGLAFSVYNPALSKHINGIVAFARH